MRHKGEKQLVKFYALILFALLSCGTRVAVASSLEETTCQQPEEHFVDVEKTRLRYVEAGTGSAVVLIHGNAGSVDDFDFKSLGRLCRDHRVVAIDRPGHGKSDRPNGFDATLQYQTHLLHDALSYLGIGHPVLVGHSWGASLALDYAIQYPHDLSALILLAPAAYSDGGPDQFMRALLKTPLIGDATLTVGRLLFGKHMVKKELEKAFYPQAVPEAYLQHASASWLRHKEVRAILEDEYTLDKELDGVSQHYYEIRIPVVVVTGDEDKVVSAKDNAYRLKDSIIQSQLVLLKNTGHQVPQTHPESIYNALTLIPGSALDQRPAANSSATHVNHFQ